MNTGDLIKSSAIKSYVTSNVINPITSNVYHSGNIPYFSGTGYPAVNPSDLISQSTVRSDAAYALNNLSGTIDASTLINSLKSVCRVLGRVRPFHSYRYYGSGGAEVLQAESSGTAIFRNNLSPYNGGKPARGNNGSTTSGPNYATDGTVNDNNNPSNMNTGSISSGNIVSASDLNRVISNMSNYISNSRLGTINYISYICHSNCHGSCYDSRGRR